MPTLREEYPEVLRQKMIKWGILKEQTDYLDWLLSLILETRYSSGFLFSRQPKKPIELIDVTAEIKDLRKRVQELEKRVGGKREFTVADIVYERFREPLEETDFGRIVAIDIESEEIVGKGDTILEAYNKARDKTGKEQFDFKRVGYKYLDKV